MSKAETWKVEALEPRERCNLILEVRASTRELAEKRFRAEAAKSTTPFGVPDATWPIISAEVVEPWAYPEGQEPVGDTLTSADDEE